ncbi:MAG: 3-hydroxyacyl-CoA dehydrogenase [Dermatophilaceae bacterium]
MVNALKPAETVGVIGVGTMGAGIAQVAAAAGHPVVLTDVAPGRAAHAVEQLRATFEKLAAKGRMTPEAAGESVGRLSVGDDLASLAGASLIIEAALERLDIKTQLFAQLEQIVSPDCILATNTSTISISAIAAPLEHGGRVVGMHFFNPAPLMRLVEVINGLRTDPDAMERVALTATAWGKTAIKVASTPGFVVNRVARPFYGEALRAYEERTASAATIDAVVRESGGFRMGPLELTDLIGQDINYASARSVWEGFGFDPRYSPSLTQGELVAAGLLGRKTGRGFYTYDGSAHPEPTSAAPTPAPSHIDVSGEWGPWEPLWTRIAEAGVDVRRGEPDGPPAARTAGASLVPVSGPTATEIAAACGRPTVVLDLALDVATATRLAVAPSDDCPTEALAEVVGVLQASGAAVSVIDDLPGMLVARTVAMLVNEAADVAARGVASPADVDAAMRLGANYPKGPLEWGDTVGARWIQNLLTSLGTHYGDGRYRPCPLLRRTALTGGKLSA